MAKLNASSTSTCCENDNILAVTSSRGLGLTSYNVTNSEGARQAEDGQNVTESYNYSSCADQLPDLQDIGLQGIAMVRYLVTGDCHGKIFSYRGLPW